MVFFANYTLYYHKSLKNKTQAFKKPVQTVEKVIFVQRKVLGNEEFPKWNPQTGFTSVEENSEFQGF